MEPRTTIARVTKMAIAAPIPMAIAVRPRRRDSQMVRAIRAAVRNGRIQVSRSNHLTAVWAGPRAFDWSRVIWPKVDGSGLPDQLATCWMPASGLMPGVMTGGLNRAERPPGSLPSAHTRTWLTSGRRLRFTSLPLMYTLLVWPRRRATTFSCPARLICSQRSYALGELSTFCVPFVMKFSTAPVIGPAKSWAFGGSAAATRACRSVAVTAWPAM